MSLPLIALLVACANKDGASTGADAPDANANRTEVPAEEPATEAASVSCAASEVVLVKETRESLSGGVPAMEIQVYDNGHWTLSGPSAKTGCLSADQLADVTAALDTAEIAAPPLEPGMARCMAMPIQTVTIEAKGETASWKSPCGPSNPTASLGALQQKLGELTSGQ